MLAYVILPPVCLYMFPNLYPFDVVATWDRAHGTRLVLIMEQKYGKYIGFLMKEAEHEPQPDIEFSEGDWQTVFTPPKKGTVCFHAPVKIAPNFETRRVARLTGPVQRRLREAYKMSKPALADFRR